MESRSHRRVLVSAGDPSGDLILSKIVAELKAIAAAKGESIEFLGLCGPRSQAEGVRPIGNAKDVAVVGLVEVIKGLPRIFRLLKQLGDEVKGVDSVLCVDFPDFNLRLAEIARKQGKPVDYIVPPQVWAWRSGRLPLMKKLIRRAYPALPFEEEFLRDAGIDAKFMGHPIRDLLPPRARTDARRRLGLAPEEFALAILPGSRGSELNRHFALLVDAWKQLEKLAPVSGLPRRWRGVWPLAPGWSREDALEHLDSSRRLLVESWLHNGTWVLSEDSREVFMGCDFGWIASGTATLEAAYYQLPHVLFYKLSPLSSWLIRALTPYFTADDAPAGLPNILLGKRVLPELLQERLSSRSLAIETVELLGNASEMDALRKSLRFVPRKLGDAGVSRRIAEDLAKTWGLMDAP